jgi:hypothetical protein
MIISHEHKFIFLKTTKTAGTSIEIALSGYCGPRDIITPISLEDEKTRTVLGFKGPQNYIIPFASYSFSDMVYCLIRGKQRQYHNHITAKLVRRFIGEETWQSYFKFCFERNPWDRAVSQYYWRRAEGAPHTFSEFIDSSNLQSLKKKGFGLYSMDGEVVVDRICLYENMADELAYISERLQLPEKLALPRSKSSSRKDKEHYRDIFNRTDREKVADLFAEEIKLLGYEF